MKLSKKLTRQRKIRFLHWGCGWGYSWGEENMVCSCIDRNGFPMSSCMGLCIDSYKAVMVEEQKRAQVKEERIANDIADLKTVIMTYIDHSRRSILQSYADGFKAGFELAKEIYD